MSSTGSNGGPERKFSTMDRSKEGSRSLKKSVQFLYTIFKPQKNPRENLVRWVARWNAESYKKFLRVTLC